MWRNMIAQFADRSYQESFDLGSENSVNGACRVITPKQIEQASG
jgi:hypothetical protein